MKKWNGNVCGAAETPAHLASGRIGTMPFVIWKDSVLGSARVSVADARPHADRLKLWYQTGETVGSAADTLAFAVRTAARLSLEDSDREVIHEANRASGGGK